MIANVVSPVAGSQGRKTVDVTLGLPFSHCLSRDHTILDYSVCLEAPGRRESDSREPRQSGPQEWQVGLACYLLCHPHGEHKVGQASGAGQFASSDWSQDYGCCARGLCGPRTDMSHLRAGFPAPKIR